MLCKTIFYYFKETAHHKGITCILLKTVMAVLCPSKQWWRPRVHSRLKSKQLNSKHIIYSITMLLFFFNFSQCKIVSSDVSTAVETFYKSNQCHLLDLARFFLFMRPYNEEPLMKLYSETVTYITSALIMLLFHPFFVKLEIIWYRFVLPVVDFGVLSLYHLPSTCKKINISRKKNLDCWHTASFNLLAPHWNFYCIIWELSRDTGTVETTFCEVLS